MPRLAVFRAFYFIVVLSIGLVAVPRPLHSVEFRVFTKSLDISVDPSSPAYSALEDCRLSFTESDKSHILDVEEKVSPQLASVSTIAAGQRHIRLKATTVSASTRVIDPSSIEAKKIRLARAYSKDLETLPSLESQAELLVAKALEEKTLVENSNIKKVGPALVATAAAPIEKPRKLLAIPRGSHGMETSPRVINVSKPSISRRPAKAVRPPAATPETGKFPIVMTGYIQFAGGSAFVHGYDEITLFHEYGGELIGLGTWRPSDNFFRIDIEFPRGRIVAQSYNRDGVIQAEGFTDLSALPLEAVQSKTLIEVFPIEEGIKLRLASASDRGYFVRKNIDEASVKLVGVQDLEYSKKKAAFFDKDVVRPSIANVKAWMKGFWPSLKFISASQPAFMNLYSEESVKSMQALVLGEDSRRDSGRKSVVWGRVFKEGNLLSEAVVDLAFRSNEKVSYFSGPIPDPSLLMTTPNGEYSAIVEDEGLEVIRVSQVGESILPVVVPTSKGHVTDADLHILPPRQFEFQAFEAETRLSIPMVANILGEVGDESLLSSNDLGFLSIRRRPIVGLSLIEADAGEKYALTRTAFKERTSLSAIPFYHNKWLSQFDDESNLEKTQPVIGLVKGNDFYVELADLEEGYAAKITYTNPGGSLRKETWGVADGGYVISGLPIGKNTVVVRPMGGTKFVTEIAVVDDRAVYYQATNL